MAAHTGSNANYLSRTSGTPNANTSWTIYCWCKINSYASNFTQVFGWNGPGGAIGCDTDETAATELGVFVSGAGSQAVAITTASYTGWIFFAIVHTSGNANYTVYWRKEFAPSLSSQVLNSTTEIVTLTTVFGVFNDSTTGTDPSNTDIRSFVFTASALSAAQVLAASQSLADPGGTNTFLALATGTSPGTNTGSGGNFTVTGTFTTTSDPSQLMPFGWEQKPSSALLTRASGRPPASDSFPAISAAAPLSPSGWELNTSLLQRRPQRAPTADAIPAIAAAAPLTPWLENAPYPRSRRPMRGPSTDGSHGSLVSAGSVSFHSAADSGLGDQKTITRGAVTNGDAVILVAWYYNDNASSVPGSVTCTPPAGFTSFVKRTYNFVSAGAVANLQINVEVFWKIASSESSTYTVTVGNNDAGASAYTNLSCLIYTGANASAPLGPWSYGTGGPSASTGTVTAPGVVAGAGTSELLFVMAGYDTPVSGAPSGMTARVTDLDGVNSVDDLSITSGATGNKTASIAGESIQQNGWIALQLVVQPGATPALAAIDWAPQLTPPTRRAPSAVVHVPLPALAAVAPSTFGWDSPSAQRSGRSTVPSLRAPDAPAALLMPAGGFDSPSTAIPPRIAARPLTDVMAAPLAPNAWGWEGSAFRARAIAIGAPSPAALPPIPAVTLTPWWDAFSPPPRLQQRLLTGDSPLPAIAAQPLTAWGWDGTSWRPTQPVRRAAADAISPAAFAAWGFDGAVARAPRSLVVANGSDVLPAAVVALTPWGWESPSAPRLQSPERAVIAEAELPVPVVAQLTPWAYSPTVVTVPPRPMAAPRPLEILPAPVVPVLTAWGWDSKAGQARAARPYVASSGPPSPLAVAPWVYDGPFGTVRRPAPHARPHDAWAATAPISPTPWGWDGAPSAWLARSEVSAHPAAALPTLTAQALPWAPESAWAAVERARGYASVADAPYANSVAWIDNGSAATLRRVAPWQSAPDTLPALIPLIPLTPWGWDLHAGQIVPRDVFAPSIEPWISVLIPTVPMLVGATATIRVSLGPSATIEVK